MNTAKSQQIVFLIGRLMVGGIYVYSAADNLMGLQGKAAYAASKGLFNPAVMVALASTVLLLAGVSLVTGIHPRLGVAAVAAFLIPVTLIMHNFWALGGMQRIAEMHNFQGNLGLLGSALMFLAIPQPWAYSLAGSATAAGAALRRLVRPATRGAALAK
jgi:uncharacterized membrane protein YphA (DoxX/SURF4 family)